MWPGHEPLRNNVIFGYSGPTENLGVHFCHFSVSRSLKPGLDREYLAHLWTLINFCITLTPKVD